MMAKRCLQKSSSLIKSHRTDWEHSTRQILSKMPQMLTIETVSMTCFCNRLQTKPRTHNHNKNFLSRTMKQHSSDQKKMCKNRTADSNSKDQGLMVSMKGRLRVKISVMRLKQPASLTLWRPLDRQQVQISITQTMMEISRIQKMAMKKQIRMTCLMVLALLEHRHKM